MEKFSTRSLCCNRSEKIYATAFSRKQRNVGWLGRSDHFVHNQRWQFQSESSLGSDQGRTDNLGDGWAVWGPSQSDHQIEKEASGEYLQSVSKKGRSGDWGTEEAYRRAVQEDRTAEHRTWVSKKEGQAAPESVKKGFVEKDNQALSIRRQCEIISFNRSSLYYERVGLSEEDQRILDG